MNMTTIARNLTRILFYLSLAILGIGMIELVVNVFGYTVLRGSYAPGRLVELSAAFMVIVIALLLRQIRDK